VPQIEDVVRRQESYIVVKKHEEPPQDADELAETDVDNKDT